MNLLKTRFEENFTHRSELGAAVSVWKGEEEICAFADGWVDREQTAPFTIDTPVCFFSVTKGLSAACVLQVLDADQIPLSTTVASIWPEFAQAGKDRITIAQLLSHQAGLCALDSTHSDLTLFNYDKVIEALAAQTPLWPPGSAHGYHTRTIGFLFDELIRRLRPGWTLGRYWQKHFAEPLQLDIWIGIPADLTKTIATIYPAKLHPSTIGSPFPPEQKTFQEALATKNSLTRRAFSSPKGLERISQMNSPEARQAEIPSMGGIGSARSLAKFYAMLGNGGKWQNQTFFSKTALDWMTHPLTSGEDKVFLLPTAFSAGFMQDPFVQDPLGASGNKLRSLFGPSKLAFGHPGAGGSHAFCDPENHFSFAYVMNQMELSIFPSQKAQGLINAVYES